MKIEINNEAAAWYEENIDVGTEKGIRFFPKLTRGSETGITIGVIPDFPYQAAVKKTVNNVTYFVEENDEWLFDSKDLHITLNKEFNEPKFTTK